MLIKKIGPALLKSSTESFEALDTISQEATIFCEDTGKFIAHYIPDFLKNESAFFYKKLNELKFNHSDRTSGISCDSIIFGSAPEDPLKNLPARNVKNTELTNAVWISLLKRANLCFQENEKDLYEKQKLLVSEKIKPYWVLPGGAFTSGIINKSNQLVFHTDNGNVKDCLSIMFCFKKGIDGGRLFLPEYKTSIEICDGSALIFDGQSVSHGVEKFRRLNQQSQRYTIVFYALSKLSRAAEDSRKEIQKFNAEQKRKLK